MYCRDKIEELRHIATLGVNIDAQLQLCQAYISGSYGQASQAEAKAYVSTFIQSAKPSGIKGIFDSTELTHSMRYVRLRACTYI
jgi:hypothetical protein